MKVTEEMAAAGAAVIDESHGMRSAELAAKVFLAMEATRTTDYVGPGEIARIKNIAPDTITRWVRTGKLKPDLMTPGGQARFSRAKVEHPEWPANVATSHGSTNGTTECGTSSSTIPPSGGLSAKAWRPRIARKRNYASPDSSSTASEAPALSEMLA